jgi:hypothetical protein
LLSVSVFSIFVAKYFVFNAWSCAATISLPVSASFYYYYYHYYYSLNSEENFVRFRQHLLK